MKYQYVDTQVGRLLLAGEQESLEYIGLPSGKGRVVPEAGWILTVDCFAEAAQQLLEYFAGERREFDLNLKPHGTDFQLDVLNALSEIPYGETTSYAVIANRIGRPKAVRAVGAANGRNPLPIVIPCHRVVGSDGSLTGFGGGLPLKQQLLSLEHEAVQPGLGI